MYRRSPLLFGGGETEDSNLEQQYCPPIVAEEGMLSLLEVVSFFAAPVGIAVSLCAALFLKNGRSYISGAVLAVLLFYATEVFLGFTGASRVLDHLGPYISQQLLFFCAFMILVGIIYWPTCSRSVNLPLVIGIGSSVAAGTILNILRC